MIKDYSLMMENPEDVPVLSQSQKEQLQARFSPTYQMLLGIQEYLKNKGHGPEFILGFLNGLQTASEMLDAFETIHSQKQEED